jgi:hypothetical protein
MDKPHTSQTTQNNDIVIRGGEWTRPTSKPRLDARPLPPPSMRA